MVVVYVPLSGKSTAVADCVHMLQQQHPEAPVIVAEYMNQCKLDMTIPGLKQYVKGQISPTLYPVGHDCPKFILLYLRRKPTVFRNISCCSVSAVPRGYVFYVYVRFDLNENNVSVWHG